MKKSRRSWSSAPVSCARREPGSPGRSAAAGSRARPRAVRWRRSLPGRSVRRCAAPLGDWRGRSGCSVRPGPGPPCPDRPPDRRRDASPGPRLDSDTYRAGRRATRRGGPARRGTGVPLATRARAGRSGWRTPPTSWARRRGGRDRPAGSGAPSRAEPAGWSRRRAAAPGPRLRADRPCPDAIGNGCNARAGGR